MRTTARRFIAFLATFIVIATTILMINQIAQLAELAARVHPTLANVVLWSLVGLLAVCLLVPLVLFFRLPRPLTPPQREDAPELSRHLDALRGRLRSNPTLKTLPLRSRQEIEQALGILERDADRLTRAAASQVFITTAISQNGSLDAFLVMATQTRLIWKIAHVYYQRPTLRDMLYLYANVASTALIASSLEEIDISEQLEPILASSLGSVAAAVPGTSLLVNSLSTGAANAFLTLRVGIIARTYCGAVVLPPKGVLRRSAAVAAARMLGSVTAEGASRVSRGFWLASRRKVGGMVRGAGDRVEDSWDWLVSKVRPPGHAEPEPDAG